MAEASYCSLDDVRDRLSAAGVTYRLDDAGIPSADGEVIEEASDTIEEYCLPHYTSANLAGSSWVKHHAANIAAVLLCERRGNPVPVGIARKYERTMEALAAVLLHGRQIPGIPQRRAAAPRTIGTRVSVTPFPHTVTQSRRSTSEPEGYSSPRDYHDWSDWVI